MNIRATSNFRPGNLAALEEKLVPRIIAAVNKGTAAVADEARTIAPAGATGELQASIGTNTTWEGKTVTGSVQAKAPYASFVEFGTGLRGQGTYPFDLPKSGVPFTGGWVYDFRRQNWKGGPAQPFMRPAIDTSHGAILGAFREEGFK